LYGIKTGCNEAFMVDAATRDAFVASDPGAAPLLRPYLRGRDVERWEAPWAGDLLITIASSGDRRWPWSGRPDEDAERIFASNHPSLHGHLKQYQGRLESRSDKGVYWWELRSCSYYDKLDEPKLLYPDILWTATFALDREARLLNNTAYFLPTGDPWLLTVLNAPVMWAYLWRNAQHGKDEALRMFGAFVTTLPIPEPDPEARAAVPALVAAVVEAKRDNQRAVADLLAWLQSRHGIDVPGRALSDFTSLSAEAFVAEVAKRRPKGASHLNPRDMRELRELHEAERLPVLRRAHEILRIEAALSAHVNRCWLLSPDEEDLVRRTAPPRMPPGLSDRASAPVRPAVATAPA
jgi:hypothetical protein